MSTTDSAPTAPPAAGSGWGQRWAVEFRPRGGRRFAVVVTAGSERLAWDALFDLMGGQGDGRSSDEFKLAFHGLFLSVVL